MAPPYQSGATVSMLLLGQFENPHHERRVLLVVIALTPGRTVNILPRVGVVIGLTLNTLIHIR